MKSEDRFKMLRGVWQIFTLLSVLLIVFGSGWPTVAVLLGMVLMTLLATFMILRVGPIDETTDVKAKRRDAGSLDQFAESVHETSSGRLHLVADGPILGDDGELVSQGEDIIGTKSSGHGAW